ncbi:MAG: FAD-binding oxidoreductase [Woeseiaceae bacterium]|nr:FAD-binding oxidoreductase [Woeseiaceae bacterium]
MTAAARSYQANRVSLAKALQPESITELQQCIDPGVAVPFPLRPRGGCTASTDCNTSSGGLVIETTGLNRILIIDPDNQRVTVEAGVRLQDLVNALDEYGLELPGCFDLYRHTVGGAVAAPCFGPGVGEDAASLARQIISMKVVTPSGELVSISADDTRFMPLFRASYGLLGVIAEVCFRVRTKRVFDRTYKKVSHEQLLKTLETLADLPIGLKFFVLPHRDRAYLEILRQAESTKSIHDRFWKAKDWGETVVLPTIFRSLNKVVPMPKLRYRLIDGVSGLTKDLSQSRLFETGSYSVAAGHRQSGSTSDTPHYSTWLFSASRASEITEAYIELCQSLFERTGYRADLPTVGFRVAKDPSALMSPSRSRAMIALQTSSTRTDGWEDFVIDLADFAEAHGGVPVFNQTRAVRSSYAQRVYGDALTSFVGVRRQLDSDNRLLNPFLSQYFS